MLPELKQLCEIDTINYNSLWQNLRGITEAELDWQPHPQANSTRWILGHLIWLEEWIPDAIAGTGRYLSDKGPLSCTLDSIAEIKSRFDAARERLEQARASLTETDLETEVDFFGAYNLTLPNLFITHTTHLAGHRYQVRYIRGTYSRAHGTNKAEFDPW